MRLNIAVQMDPIERISIRGDSTFALLLEAQKRGHGIAYYTPDRLALLGAKVVASVQPLKVRDQQGDHFTLGEARRTELTEFDVVLLRQDPPFDLAYITTTHLLERIQPGTLVVNEPSAVRNAPEKMFVMEFPELMPPTLITRDLAEIKAFRAKHGDIVMKPLYGKGGEAVFRLAKEDLNFGSLYDLFTVTFREQWVVQKFLPAVKDGDKRILLVDGEFAGAVNRVPAPDDLRSNMARGGTPTETELTARERDICVRIGPALRERGLLFVGIDVIDGYLTEINVTSPTGRFLRLEALDRGADRRERPVFVLLLAKAVGIRTVGCVDRLLQKVGKVLVEAGFVRPRLGEDVSRNVPGLFRRKLRVQVVDAVRHVEVKEICGRDQPRHSGAVVEAVIAPERRHHVAEVGGRQAAADAGAIGTVTGDAGIGVECLAARGIGRAVELGHIAGAHSRQQLPRRDAGR